MLKRFKMPMLELNGLLMTVQFSTATNGKFSSGVDKNHLNLVMPTESSAISIEGLVKLLQTQVVNSLFRCINGTVTVSASELIRLPMPTAEGFRPMCCGVGLGCLHTHSGYNNTLNGYFQGSSAHEKVWNQAGLINGRDSPSECFYYQYVRVEQSPSGHPRRF